MLFLRSKNNVTNAHYEEVYNRKQVSVRTMKWIRMNKVSHENKIAIWVCMDGDKKKWDIYGF